MTALTNQNVLVTEAMMDCSKVLTYFPWLLKPITKSNLEEY